LGVQSCKEEEQNLSFWGDDQTGEGLMLYCLLGDGVSIFAARLKAPHDEKAVGRVVLEGGNWELTRVGLFSK